MKYSQVVEIPGGGTFRVEAEAAEGQQFPEIVGPLIEMAIVEVLVAVGLELAPLRIRALAGKASATNANGPGSMTIVSIGKDFPRSREEFERRRLAEK